jgi:FkbM family methyltransferase
MLEDTLNGGYRGLYGEVVTEDCYRLKQLEFVPDVIFDLGANIGVFTRYAKELFPYAHIISVEPHSENFLDLKKYTENNNVDFINKAIGIGTIYRLASDINSAHESYINDSRFSNNSQLIECTTPNDLISLYLKATQKSFLKLDIEGNENVIWKHTESMAALKKIDFIAMELHFDSINWNDEDRANTYKMMEYFSDTHDCEFAAPMFYAKKK